MIHIIDHRDSFTWNVVHQLSPYGEISVVDASDIKRVKIENADLVVFSPGPGSPADYPETIALYNKVKGRVPVLGICLGFQIILAAEGAGIVPQERVLHGVQSIIGYKKESIAYRNIEPPLRVGRYHSLCVERDSIPENFIITSWDEKNSVPLSFEHINMPIFGFQYHPDSFLTEHGKYIIENIFCELGFCAKSG
jgi:anthranilate synthase/aminodeoxychorismate synthase-like glutamine amidotransferase